MKKRFLAMALVLLVAACSLAGCGRLKATTMRLISHEGRITLEENGKHKKIKENLRINSGSEIKTSYYSSATIGLDDVKVVSMDQESVAEFTQDGKKLEMTLTKGSIFFEVKKPLEADETFNIRTSTMICGIRGTSGYVEVYDDGTERLIVTDGVVHVTLIDPETGEVKETDVSAGEQLKVYGEYKEGLENFFFEFEKLTSEIIPAFARNYILLNEELKEKISEDIGKEELDAVLWDETVGYEPYTYSYGSYNAYDDVLTALEQLEMVFRIAGYALDRDAEGLKEYLESKDVPGAEYIANAGMRIYESLISAGY